MDFRIEYPSLVADVLVPSKIVVKLPSGPKDLAKLEEITLKVSSVSLEIFLRDYINLILISVLQEVHNDTTYPFRIFKKGEELQSEV